MLRFLNCVLSCETMKLSETTSTWRDNIQNSSTARTQCRGHNAVGRNQMVRKNVFRKLLNLIYIQFWNQIYIFTLNYKYINHICHGTWTRGVKRRRWEKSLKTLLSMHIIYYPVIVVAIVVVALFRLIFSFIIPPTTSIRRVQKE